MHLITAALFSVLTAPRPSFTDTFPWSRVPTMCQTHIPGIFSRRGMIGTGRFADDVVRFLADNYAIVVANGLEPGLPEQCQEKAIQSLADRIHAYNPNTKVLMYQANQLVHSRNPALLPPGSRPETLLPCGLENVKREWLATSDDGTLYDNGGKSYVHNLSIPAMRQQWLNVILNKTLGDNVAGVFADNSFDHASSPWMSSERAKAFLDGQQKLLASVVAAGKFVIFNGLRLHYARNTWKATDDLDGLSTLLPHASAGYFEPWLSAVYRNTTTGKLNASMASHALLRMINASSTHPDKGIVFKAGPGPCVGYIAGQAIGCSWPFANHSTKPIPNKMNGTPQTAKERRDAAAKLLTFPLATFLCAAGPKWHLDYTWGYTINDFVPGLGENKTIPGQPSLESNTPDNWYPDLLRAPGSPLGECVFDASSYTFTREWSGVSVRVNMEDETAVVEWKN